jgi:hypothetical protein
LVQAQLHEKCEGLESGQAGFRVVEYRSVLEAQGSVLSAKWSWYFPETGGKIVWAEVRAE